MGWNLDQEKAIHAREGNYLVSAGAGSGKTAVLTERVKEIIIEGEKERDNNVPLEDRKGAKVSELLVLTFTNKAAGEMKGRIQQALLEAYRKGELKKDVSNEVETGDICTFDSYYFALVSKYHLEIGLPKDITIGSEDLFLTQEEKILEEIFLKYYEKKDKDFISLVLRFANHDDEPIKEIVRDILRKANASINPEEFIASLPTFYFSDDYFASRKDNWISFQKDRWNNLVEEYNALFKDSDNIYGLLSPYFALSTATISTDLLFEFFSKVGPFPTAKDLKLKKVKEGEMVLTSNQITALEKAKFDAFRGKYNAFAGDFLKIGKFEESMNDWKNEQGYVRVLSDIAKEVHDKLLTFKREKNIYSFCDIAFFAREILKKENIREEVKNKYRYIMVDEYQDTCDLQEDFLSLISNNNLFCVGDMKQSIYGFRNANPDNFRKKFIKYRNHDDGELITLNTNYRSSRNVIEDINHYFEETMNEELGDIAYDQNQSLLFGNKALYGEDKKAIYETEVLSFNKNKGESSLEGEITAVVNDILSKVGKYEIPLRNGGKRKATFGDFVILSRNKTNFVSIARIFNDAQIPLLVADDMDLFNEDIFLIFKRFLILYLNIDTNEIEEKHSYASIMRSYLYQASDLEIANALLDGSYKNSPLFTSFREIKKKMTSLPLGDAISLMLHSYPFYENLPIIGKVIGNYEKLNGLIEKAIIYEKIGYSIEDFINNFFDEETYKIKESIEPPSESVSSACLMTIHQSKGLQFPIVYQIGNQKDLLRHSLKLTSSSVSKDFGVLLPVIQNEEEKGTPLSMMLSYLDEKKSLSEEMRLEYVALTRSECKFIFVKEEKEGISFEPLTIKSYGKLRFISDKNDPSKMEPKFSILKYKTYSNFTLLSKNAFPNFKKVVAIKDKPLRNEDEVFNNSLNKIELREINFPPKIKEKKRASKENASIKNLSKLIYGTYLHRILEVTSFIKKDLSFLEEGPLKEKISKVLNLPLFSNLNGAKEYHEYAFYDGDNNLTGSIDLLLIEDDVAYIIDFKTKDINDPDYKKQLDSYKDYVSKVFKKKVHTYLLSLSDISLKEIE